MALIKCGECGKEISDKAPACPGCGNPINGGGQIKEKVIVIEQTSKIWKAYQLIFGITFLVGLFMAFSHAGSKIPADIEALELGNFFVGLGIIGWVFGSLGAWWNHR